MIKLFTDSVSYIPLDIQVEHNIKILPLKVVVDGKEYYENKISNQHFYESIRTDNQIAKTLPVTVKAAEKAFEDEVKAGHQILGIFMSSKISDTYKNVRQASLNVLKKHPKAKIEIIDSQAAAMQEGFAVLAAAEKIAENAWFEDVVNAAKENIKRTRFLFIPDNLKYMEIGGRVNKFQSMFGGLMKLIPIIMPRDGEVKLYETVRTKVNAIQHSLEVMQSDINTSGIKKVVVSHIDSFDEAMELAKQAEEIARVEVSISDVGPAIGAHVGPGAVGITYQTVDEIPQRAVLNQEF